MKGHNTEGQLRSLVERIENLEESIKELQSDKSDIYAEAKGAGFDVKALKAIIKERKQDRDKAAELEAILDTYRHALGMLDGTPLGQAAIERAAR